MLRKVTAPHPILPTLPIRISGPVNRPQNQLRYPFAQQLNNLHHRSRTLNHHLFRNNNREGTLHLNSKRRCSTENRAPEVKDKPPTPAKKKYIILSIDGGGIRGILPASILTEIEKRTSRPTTDFFDLIAGTSTGGILTLGLTAPKKVEKPDTKEKSYDTTRPQYSAAELLELYQTRGRDIFANSFYSVPGIIDIVYASVVIILTTDLELAPDNALILGAISAMYPGSKTLIITGAIAACSTMLIRHCPIFMDFPTELISSYFIGVLGSRVFVNSFIRFLGETKYLDIGLLRILKKYFADRKLNDTIKPVLLASYNLTDRKPMLFTSTPQDASVKHDYFMSDIIKATTSAPAFFDPYLIDNKKFIDGGVVANDPALCAVIHAISRGVNIDDIYVISIGTGTKQRSAYDFINKGLAYVASKLPTFLMDTQVELVENQLEQLLTKNRYKRINIPLSRMIGLDSVSKKNIQFLLSAANTYIQNHNKEIDELCKFLLSSGDDTNVAKAPDLNIANADNNLQPEGLTVKQIRGLILVILFLLFLFYMSYVAIRDENEIKKFVKKSAENRDYKTAFEHIEMLNNLPGATELIKAHVKLMGLTVIIRQAASNGDFEIAINGLNQLHSLAQKRGPRVHIYEASASTFLAEKAAHNKQYDIAVKALNTYQGTHYRKKSAVDNLVKIATENIGEQAANELRVKIK